MSRFCFCNCPAGFSAEPERHAPDCPGRSGAGKARTPVPATTPALKVTAAEELDAVLHWRGKHSIAVRERDGLQLSLNTADQAIDDLSAAVSRRTHRVRELEALLAAADERADVLEAVSVKQAALLDELGIPLDEVDDLFGETLKNAKRYEYLRSVMAVENFPAPHPAWSEPSEAESKRIDYLCDAALKPEEGRGDVD